MHRFVLFGAGAVAAGMLFGAASLALGHESPPPPATPTLTVVATSVASVFLAPTAIPIAAATTAPTSVPTDTPVPPTLTPIPPTATATPIAPTKSGNAPAPNVNAVSIAVVDEGSGALLYGKDPHHHLAPASLTKIFTALVALNHGGLQQPITVQFDQSELVDSTLMGIKPGETYTLENLLYGLMLPSGNDAALAIANDIGGNEANFATMMNAQAQALGLTDSHFVNAHGLDAPSHYSSAYDLAMAARYGIMEYPEFRTLAGTKAWQVQGTRSYWIYNLNRFLRSYNGADGVKIGYTDNSGPAIVASATRNGHRVYVALLHCGDIVGDSVPLFNWVFQNFTWPANAPTAAPAPGATPG